MKALILVSVFAVLALSVTVYSNSAPTTQENSPTQSLPAMEMRSFPGSTPVPPGDIRFESSSVDEEASDVSSPSGFPDMRLYHREFPTPAPYYPVATPTGTVVQYNLAYPPPGGGEQLTLPMPAATAVV